MNQGPGKQLVAEAKMIAGQADSWITLSNALTDPQGGLITRYFPDAAQRQAFLLTPEYAEIEQILLQIMKEKGLYPRVASEPTRSTG
jgi:hypothetical protein